MVVEIGDRYMHPDQTPTALHCAAPSLVSTVTSTYLGIVKPTGWNEGMLRLVLKVASHFLYSLNSPANQKLGPHWLILRVPQTTDKTQREIGRILGGVLSRGSAPVPVGPLGFSLFLLRPRVWQNFLFSWSFSVPMWPIYICVLYDTQR